jgi:hypothetical protein
VSNILTTRIVSKFNFKSRFDNQDCVYNNNETQNDNANKIYNLIKCKSYNYSTEIHYNEVFNEMLFPNESSIYDIEIAIVIINSTNTNLNKDKKNDNNYLIQNSISAVIGCENVIISGKLRNNYKIYRRNDLNKDENNNSTNLFTDKDIIDLNTNPITQKIRINFLKEGNYSIYTLYRDIDNSKSRSSSISSINSNNLSSHTSTSGRIKNKRKDKWLTFPPVNINVK